MAATIKQGVEPISPEWAKKYLATQKKNRRAIPAHVEFLRSIMDRGAWGVAQPIIFDSDGHLIDGQHRLLAVIEHCKTVSFAVMRGVDPDLWSALDTGRGRKGADVLSAEGHASSSLLAATLRLVWQDEIGMLGSSAPEARPSNADLIDRDAEHPEIGKEIIRAVSVCRFARRAPIAFLYWRSHRVNAKVAAAFWPGVLTGEGLSRGTAPWLLYGLLIDQLSGGRRLQMNELLAYSIKAWNAALATSCPKFLRWSRSAEEMPPICATRTEADEAYRTAKERARENVGAS